MTTLIGREHNIAPTALSALHSIMPQKANNYFNESSETELKIRKVTGHETSKELKKLKCFL